MSKPIKIKKSTWLPAVLLAYLAFMSAIAYPDYRAGVHTPLFYFGVIGFTLVVIIALHFFLKKKESLRQERENATRS